MLTSFFLLLPHLLRFTLFPYTTLFRSVIEASYLMAYQDGLTGLPARRALTEALHQMNGKFTIAMVDVDHFKKLNDRYGHDVGDQVLRMLASRLAKVSNGGRAFRYGGEEFEIGRGEWRERRR